MEFLLRSDAWWGEGEAKFYFDGDKEFLTITSTELEDYFCVAYNFMANSQYTLFTNLYCGLPQLILSDRRCCLLIYIVRLYHFCGFILN